MIQPFTFIGFLPRKNQQADELLMRYQYRTETLVIYESPLRIGKTFERLYQILGNRRISIARELTKTFETIIRTDLKEASTMEHQTKGEYVIIIEGTHESSSFNEETIQDHYLRYIHLGYPDKDAIKQVAKDRKIPKSDVYQQIKIKKDLS